jgi:hypothetical protein
VESEIAFLLARDSAAPVPVVAGGSVTFTVTGSARSRSTPPDGVSVGEDERGGAMPTSVAAVPTDAAERYAKQLLAHIGRKNPVEPVEGAPSAGRLVFPYGVGVVRPDGDRLVLEATAPDDESLARVQDVLGRHLERFGARRELVVHWST